MIWTQGVIELYRWRQQRKALAAQAAKLIAEAEAFLAERCPVDERTVQPPAEPRRRSKPPRFR